MRKGIIIIVLLSALLILAGCFVSPSMDEDTIQAKVISFEQSYSFGTKTGVAINGEKCSWGCCPECPECDSCCEDCEICETCEECEECETCEECEECQEIPECPGCPCWAFEWGNLDITYELTNSGNTDFEINEICFKISFSDGTNRSICIDSFKAILAGETITKEVILALPEPAKRVIFVVVESID